MAKKRKEEEKEKGKEEEEIGYVNQLTVAEMIALKVLQKTMQYKPRDIVADGIQARELLLLATLALEACPTCKMDNWTNTQTCKLCLLVSSLHVACDVVVLQ